MHPSVERLIEFVQTATGRRDQPMSAMSLLLQSTLGVSSASFTNWKSRGISKDGALKAEAVYGCSAHWLLTGEGASIASEREAHSLPPNFRHVAVADELSPELEAIRVMRLKLRAGMSGFAVEPDDSQAAPIFFRSDWLQSRGFKPYNLIANRVNGPSMETTLYDGDLVVTHVADTEPVDGEVYSINYEGEPVIKRLMREGGAWWLTSDNTDKKRFPNKKWVDDTALIVGRIVHRQSERI